MIIFAIDNTLALRMGKCQLARFLTLEPLEKTRNKAYFAS